MAPPLLTTSVLLSRALVSLRREFDERTGVGDSLPLWANVLQHVEDDRSAEIAPLPDGGRSASSGRRDVAL